MTYTELIIKVQDLASSEITKEELSTQIAFLIIKYCHEHDMAMNEFPMDLFLLAVEF